MTEAATAEDPGGAVCLRGRALGALAASVLVALAYGQRAFVIDDAFISLRYAQNLAAGHGPVFNVGEPEWGYSNPSWVFLEAALFRFGLDALAGIRLLGLLLSLAALWPLMRLAERRGAGAWAGLAPLLWVLSPSAAIWAVGGLETPLYVVLLLVALDAHDRGAHRLGAAAALGLAATRPEGVGLAGVLALASLTEAGAGWRGRLPAWGVALAAFLVGWLALWSFHGAPVPNSFAMKFLGASPGVTFRWSQLLSRPMVPWAIHLLLPLAAGLADTALRGDRRDGPMLVSLGYCLAVAFATWDWMPGYRYYAPATALVAVLAARATARAAQAVEGMDPRPTRPRIVAAGLALAGLALLPLLRDLAGGLGYARRYAVSLEECFMPTARWIAENTSPDATICLSRIGAIPYLAQRRTIGLDGLIHLDFVRHGYRPEYVLDRAPEVIVMQVRDPASTDTSDPYLRPIQRHPRFAREYRLETTLGDARHGGVDGGRFAIYRRRPEGA